MKNVIAAFEIRADDPDRAVAFYQQVFGWQFVKDVNISIEYWRLQADGGLQGAILQRPAERAPDRSGTNAYVCSIMVDHFDVTAESILENGGMAALAKFAVPGRCWQGYFIDTDGNTFGIFEVDPNAQ